MEKDKEISQLHDFQKRMHSRIEEYAKEKELADSDCKSILDGVADIPGYATSSPKVMWVLKEAWGKEDENGKITGGGYKIWECWEPKKFNTPTWLPMIYTLYGIRQGENRVEYRDMPKADESMVELLKQSAYVNLNKMPGKTISGNMREKYNLWREIILEQIEAYNPDIIIFGGTFDTMKEDLRLTTDQPIIKTPTEEIAHFYRDRKGRLLVNAMHPAQHHISWDYYIDEIVDRIRALNI
ncbi:MAG: hypothetical protein K2K81_08250 [Muribaculaceae bacterium]|nr:hypothetical protein [Muribaculaceae bacterium]